MKLTYIILAVILWNMPLFAKKDVNVLVFTKTNAYRHKNIEPGKKALKLMAQKEDWLIQFTEDSTQFTNKNLSKFNVVVFFNTSGNVLGESEQQAFKRFIQKGGGFVGIHQATGTENEWPWFNKLTGAIFKNHPKVQEAELHVHKETGFPAIMHLNEKWVRTDEWYNFTEEVDTSVVTILIDIDEDSYEGRKMGTYHPTTWYHYYDGGRAFYTALGHTDDSFSEAPFLLMIQKAIYWASDTK